MRFNSLLAACVFGLASVNAATRPTRLLPSEAENTTSVGVIQARDIGVQPLFSGRPLPQQLTLYTLFYAKLELYRMTVAHGGDNPIQSLSFDLEDESHLHLDIRPFEHEGKFLYMTSGSSIYGVSSILKTMLKPERDIDGFNELRWRIYNRNLLPGTQVPMGYLNLLLGCAEALRNESSTSPASVLQSMSKFNASRSSPMDLSAPFPVPETAVTLLVGPRGADLVQGNVVYMMDDLMNSAWQLVARAGNVRPCRVHTWNSAPRERISVTLRPRMNGDRSIVNTTDLAEAAFGIAYFFANHQPAFETTITIVRPDESGRRVPIGEIEIAKQRSGIKIGGSGNDSAIEKS